MSLLNQLPVHNNYNGRRRRMIFYEYVLVWKCYCRPSSSLRSEDYISATNNKVAAAAPYDGAIQLTTESYGALELGRLERR